MPEDPRTREQEIRAWYARHQHDYCPDHHAPPVVWSEHFKWLLDQLPVRDADGVVRAREARQAK
jgi:hypothetical protein